MSIAVLTPALSWNEVETGFHVANRAGEFAGYIDVNPDGSAIAFDSHAFPIGRFADLRTAKASLLTTPHPVNVRRRRRIERLTAAAATGLGGIALTLALTAGVLAPRL